MKYGDEFLNSAIHPSTEDATWLFFLWGMLIFITLYLMLSDYN